MVRILFAVTMCLCPTLVFAQAKLENPAPNSVQSGLGLISGWKCAGANLTAQVDGVVLALPYGSQRSDTQGLCGDANNGFGLLVNWNLLPNGAHTLRLLDNGVEFARVTFTTQSLGQQFLTGANRTVTVPDFPSTGQTTTLRWQESLQNFVVSGFTAGGGSSALHELLGTWEFLTTIITVFRDHYHLERIETVDGIPFIRGTDLDQGDPIVAARVTDLIDDPFPYDFALLDVGTTICDLFIFDKTGVNTVTGADVLFHVAGGRCTTPTTGIQHRMVGTRTASAISSAVNRDKIKQPRHLLDLRESIKLEEDLFLLSLEQETDEIGRQLTPEALQALVSALQVGP